MRIEYFGAEYKNPPFPASVSSRQAIPFRGSMFRADTSEAAVRTIEEGWNERQPRFVLLMPDYTNPGKPIRVDLPAGNVSRAGGRDDGVSSGRAVPVAALLPFIRKSAGARLPGGESADPHLRADCVCCRERAVTPETRQRLFSFVRFAIAIALLAFLAGSGVIEWPKMRGLLHAWPLTLAALALLFLGFVMASWRFCRLTGAQGLHVSLANSVRLTLIGNAANLVLPTVGSDLVRLWFASDGHAGRRTEIATIVLLDRVLGLVGILLLPIALAPVLSVGCRRRRR